jgi:hypothetical protein
MRALVFLALAGIACCTPAPAPVTPTTDASDAMPAPPGPTPPLDAAEMACQHLRDLKCPLGSDPKCGTVFRLPSKFKADPTCVLGATTIAGLQPCNVTCQPQ